MSSETGKELIGKRIKLISMPHDPNPIQRGDIGTVWAVSCGVLHVKWDSGRGLSLIFGVANFEILN